MLFNFLTWLIRPTTKPRRRSSSDGSEVQLLLAWILLICAAAL
jgi:hypothetical protein